MIIYIKLIILELIDKADAVIYRTSLVTRLGEETYSTSNAFFVKIMEVIKTSWNKATNRGDQGNIEPLHIPKIRFSATNNLVPMNLY